MELKAKTLLVLLCTVLALSMLPQCGQAVREMPKEIMDDDLDDMDEMPSNDRGQGRYATPNSNIEAERRQAEMEMNTVGKSLSLSEQLANVAEMMPLADYLRLRQRILRLGVFCDYTLETLNRQGLRPPMDKVALVLLFIVSSYIPALVATIFYTALCKKPQLPKFDPSMHIFNKPDAAEMTKILQTVTKIQDSVSKLQNQGGNGSVAQGGQSDTETQRILMQTQTDLSSLGQNLQTLSARQEQQSRKLEEMDKRINKNFSIMFDSLCKKIEDSRPSVVADQNMTSPRQELMTSHAPSTQQPKTNAIAPTKSPLQNINKQSQPQNTANQQQQSQEDAGEEEYEYYEEDEDQDV